MSVKRCKLWHLLLYCNAADLLYCNAADLLYCNADDLLYCNADDLLYCNAADRLYCNADDLLYCKADVGSVQWIHLKHHGLLLKPRGNEWRGLCFSYATPNLLLLNKICSHQMNVLVVSKDGANIWDSSKWCLWISKLYNPALVWTDFIHKKRIGCGIKSWYPPTPSLETHFTDLNKNQNMYIHI